MGGAPVMVDELGEQSVLYGIGVVVGVGTVE